jgi:hypothetical protein
MSNHENIPGLEQAPDGYEPGGYSELYIPTEAVKELMVFDPERLDKIKVEAPKASELELMERYFKIIDHGVAEAEPDVVRARSADDGNNVVYPVIMYTNYKAAGDLRKFAGEGRDLEIVQRTLKDSIDRGYNNLASYKLWAGLYLDLREALLGAEQNK